MFVFSLAQKQAKILKAIQLLIPSLSFLILWSFSHLGSFAAEPQAAPTIPPLPAFHDAESMFGSLGPHGYLPLHAIDRQLPSEQSNPVPETNRQSTAANSLLQHSKSVRARTENKDIPLAPDTPRPLLPHQPRLSPGVSAACTTFQVIREAQVWWVINSNFANQQAVSPSDASQKHLSTTGSVAPMTIHRLLELAKIETRQNLSRVMKTGRIGLDEIQSILNHQLSRVTGVAASKILPPTASEILASARVPIQVAPPTLPQTPHDEDGGLTFLTETPDSPKHAQAAPLPVNFLNPAASVTSLQSVELHEDNKSNSEHPLLGGSAIIFSLDEPYLAYDLNPSDRWTPRARVTLQAPVITSPPQREAAAHESRQDDSTEIWNDFDFMLTEQLSAWESHHLSANPVRIAHSTRVRQPANTPRPPLTLPQGIREAEQGVTQRFASRANREQPVLNHASFTANQVGHVLSALSAIQVLVEREIAREIDSQWNAIQEHWLNQSQLDPVQTHPQPLPSSTGLALLERAKATDQRIQAQVKKRNPARDNIDSDQEVLEVTRIQRPVSSESSDRLR
ncbi:MAG: hypothetical protein ACPHL6_05110 [Rubripirellula sp.]